MIIFISFTHNVLVYQRLILFSRLTNEYKEKEDVIQLCDNKICIACLYFYCVSFIILV